MSVCSSDEMVAVAAVVVGNQNLGSSFLLECFAVSVFNAHRWLVMYELYGMLEIHIQSSR